MTTSFRVGAPALALLMLISAGARPALGVLVAYDPFKTGSVRGNGEYDPGVDMRTMGAAALGWVGTGPDGFGIAHSGSTGNFQGNAVGEDSAAVLYEQPGRMQWLGVGDSVFDRQITRQLNPTPTSTEWWFSIMVNRLGWADVQTNTFVVGGFTGADGTGLQIGYDDSATVDVPANNIPDLVIRLGGANTVVTPDVGPNDNQFVLVKLEINTTGNDTVSIWADPASVVTLPTPTLVIDTLDLFNSEQPFTQSKYESPARSGVTYFDEIRLATTQAAILGELPVPNVPGDFNNDTVVDAADYTVWRDNLGAADETAINNNGDGGDISLSDYTLWVNSFGGPAVGALGTDAVPEPGALSVAGLSLCLGLALGRKRSL